MEDTLVRNICQRIAQVRTETSGARGKSAFAKALGLSPSTYEYYESSRVPPADILLRIAALAGVDVMWLLTGQTASNPIAADNPILQRAARLLAEAPQAAAPLAAFVELLAKATAFPTKDATAPDAAMPAVSAPGGMATHQAGRHDSPEAPAHQPPAPTDPAPDRLGWLPVLGRSAAGVAQFWIDKAQAEGITQLADLVARQGRQEHLHRATASQSDSPAGDSPVWLVTLRAPDESDVVEFVAAPQLKARYADAFALRIDGESMAPDIRHGDLVVLSPSAPAVDGRAAVVQLDGQIGVTCKLYRRAGRDVHLLPVNEHFPSQTFPASQVLWAFRVLARVRM